MEKIKVENWLGHEIRFVEYNGHEIRFIEHDDGKRTFVAEDCAKAFGYIPIAEALGDDEWITNVLPMAENYFALTTRKRLLYVLHWYGDSGGERILVPDVATEARRIYELDHVEKINERLSLTIKAEYTFPVYDRDVDELPEDMPEIIQRVAEVSGFKEYLKKENTDWKNKFKAHKESYYEYHKDIHGVYLVKADNGLVKIGMTSDINERLRSLRTNSPCELKLVGFIKTFENSYLEHKLHQEYENKRSHGEWFCLTDDDIKTILSNANL